MKITFVTGNKTKYASAAKVLIKYGIELEQHNIETPEIQSTDSAKIAAYSARYAADEIGRPVIVTDVGWHIIALGGFPGPFIKYINEWLTPDDIMRLMAGVEDKTIKAIEVAAYCEPGKEPKVFITEDSGYITEKPEHVEDETTLDNILVLPEFGIVSSLVPHDKKVDYWASHLTHYHQLGKYLKSKKNY
ncbi:MAG: non-canonical purine NTP pyrophosphatase [bacterium]